MTTLLAGVIGWPVSHTLSPRMHGFWLRELAIDGAYVALPVRRHDLSDALAGLLKAGFSGANLTAPHKEAAFAMAHTADPAACAAKAANLLLFQKGQFHAANTDVEGLVLSLTDGLRNKEPGIRRSIVLGAGGAARAAVLSCDHLGIQEICVLNRTDARAAALACDLSGCVKANLTAAAWRAWEALAPEAQLLINATSAGLNGAPSPDISLEALPRRAVVCELIYSPLETPLLARARALGLAVVDGLGMLMHQGALGFELLFGARPTVSPSLRSYLELALRNAR
ncbi:MAG TPA: shikimate dehydrogenase [Rhizomicrobium sp.]|jgi:shikimate dehydrogenase|nr:shikimate dehydrogenase [Rhizomicrobium sp.]